MLVVVVFYRFSLDVSEVYDVNSLSFIILFIQIPRTSLNTVALFSKFLLSSLLRLAVTSLLRTRILGLYTVQLGLLYIRPGSGGGETVTDWDRYNPVRPGQYLDG